MKKYFAILMSTAFLLSCSDFLNSTKVGGSSGDEVLPPGKFKPFDENFNPNTGNFSEAKMLANIGLNVIEPAVRRFSLQAQILEQNISDLCTGLEQEQESLDLEQAVKIQWEKTMLAYHFVNAIPIGPAVDRARLIADSIYSWPLVNFCGVDQEVVNLANTKQVNDRVLFTSKGLGALEYLFYDSSLGTVCNPKSAANQDIVAWTKKSALEKRQDRCSYAKVVSEDLSSQARQLASAWHPKEGNFSRGLMEGVYENMKETVNHMSHAVFNIETVKDLRLGVPLGQNKDCYSDEGKCPDNVEHIWSGLALKAVAAEVEAFRAVYHGSQNPKELAFGFDDYLTSKGQSGVASFFTTQSEEVLNRVATVSELGPLRKQILDMNVTDCNASTAEDVKVPVCSMYQDLRHLTKRLKVDFLVLLSLRAPPSTEGDND